MFSPNSVLADRREEESYSLLADIIVSYTLCHTLVISTWWSMWEMENNFILHDCEIVIKDIQAWDSVILSLLFCGLVFSLDRRVRAQWESGGACTSLLCYSMAVLSLLASLNFWRGVWSLMDFYFFPSMELSLNLLLSHAVGFAWSIVAGTGLTLTQSSARDPPAPEFNGCRYWRDILESSGRHLPPSEHTPILARETSP